MSTALQQYQKDVKVVCHWLEEFLAGRVRHPDGEPSLPTSFEALGNSPGTVAYANELIPVCELVSAWHVARFPATGAPSPPSAAAPPCDAAFLLAASALPGLNPNFDPEIFLSSAAAWTPVERVRLLGPLVCVLGYAVHPAGLAAMPVDVAAQPAFNLIIGNTMYLGYSLVLHVLTLAVVGARRLHEVSEAGGPAPEEQAAAVAAYAAKADEAAWEIARALGRRVGTDVGDVRACVDAFSVVVDSPRMMKIIMIDAGDVIRREVSQASIKRSVEVARLLVTFSTAVAARPEELKNLDSDLLYFAEVLTQTGAGALFSKNLIAAQGVVGTPAAVAALTATARVARDMALASSPTETNAAAVWMCTAMLTLHPPRSWAGEAGEVMAALGEVTEAFALLVTRKAAMSPGVLDYMGTMLLAALYHTATDLFVFLGQNTDSFPLHAGPHTCYLRHARGDAAAHVAVLQAVRGALVVATFLSQPDYLQAFLAPVFLPRAPAALAPSASVEQAGVAVAAAVELFKFMLGPTRAKLGPKTGVPEGALLAWVCCAAFADACVWASAACAAPSRSAGEGEAKRHLERLLAAAALKFLVVAAQERDGMEGAFLRGELAAAAPPPDHPQAVKSWEGALGQACHVIAAKMADLDGALAPALAPGDAEGLRVFSGVAAGSGVGGEAASRVGALAAAAAATDPRGEAAAKARARLLAALDCSSLACSEVRVQGAGGLKKCTGCRCVRYCSRECQLADWKAHRLACRAIQAEGGA